MHEPTKESIFCSQEKDRHPTINPTNQIEPKLSYTQRGKEIGNFPKEKGTFPSEIRKTSPPPLFFTKTQALSQRETL